ncbi:hypothetical protein LEP1GSC061_1314 [Leptospira wolffii serovar Khorat str. Khorat-H2]|nr:hypothetical protein LEP1GSC061_1314 [Leptospira wolffii serovar Khorat str. Khorat-H2]
MKSKKGAHMRIIYSKITILFLLSGLEFLACSLIRPPRFEKEKLEAYIIAFQELKASDPISVSHFFTPDPRLVYKLPPSANGISWEKILKKNGFSSYGEFAILHFQIREFYDLYKSEKLIEEMESANVKYAENFQKFLSDPEFPESAKEQIRGSLAKSRDFQEKNLKESKRRMEALKTNSDPSYEFVKERSAQLKELYSD